LVDAVSGEETRRLGTAGVSLDFESGGFDRRSIMPSPSLEDGRLYVGSRDGHLYCFDEASGEVVWRYYTPDAVWSSFALAGELAYFGDWKGTLYPFEQSNREISWRFHAGGAIYSSPLVDDGMVIFGSDPGCVYALEGPAVDPRRQARRLDRPRSPGLRAGSGFGSHDVRGLRSVRPDAGSLLRGG
jgi:hypothetical protein